MRKKAVIAWLAVPLTGIIALFWYNDWVYARPTPVPKNYEAVETGSEITFPSGLIIAEGKPVFLHFFNPDCPCSRFNMTHFKTLVKQYGQQVNFSLVLMTDQNYTAKEIQKRFGIDIPVILDTTIAASCGVYSTPQAVIIDTKHLLYYRGNYNRTRYCADKKTEYARIALETLLQKTVPVSFDSYALKAYGCKLPKCNK